MPPARPAAVTLRLGEPLEHPGLSAPITLEAFVPETVEPDPGDPDDPTGTGINLTLQIGGHAEETYFNADPSAPPPEIWTHGMRIVVVEYDDAVPSIGIAIDRVSSDFVGQPRAVTVKRGESLELDDGASMEFIGHSHKRTMEGDTSPLIVEVRYSPAPNSVSYHSLRPPEHATWTWRDYEFELLEWDYDTRMDLAVRRRRLVPL